MKRKIKFFIQRLKRGWSDDECWDMQYYLLKWINEHFKTYLEQATIIDLTYHKWLHKGKEWTQEDLMKRVIKLTDLLMDEDGYLETLVIEENGKIMYEAKEELYDILKILHFQLWW